MLAHRPLGREADRVEGVRLQNDGEPWSRSLVGRGRGRTTGSSRLDQAAIQAAKGKRARHRRSALGEGGAEDRNCLLPRTALPGPAQGRSRAVGLRNPSGWDRDRRRSPLVVCQSALKIDPLSACKVDPLSGTVEVVPVVHRRDPRGGCLLAHRGNRAACALADARPRDGDGERVNNDPLGEA